MVQIQSELFRSRFIGPNNFFSLISPKRNGFISYMYHSRVFSSTDTYLLRHLRSYLIILFSSFFVLVSEVGSIITSSETFDFFFVMFYCLFPIL